jgi:hypothetical protein
VACLGGQLGAVRIPRVDAGRPSAIDPAEQGVQFLFRGPVLGGDRGGNLPDAKLPVSFRRRRMKITSIRWGTSETLALQ